MRRSRGTETLRGGQPTLVLRVAEVGGAFSLCPQRGRSGNCFSSFVALASIAVNGEGADKTVCFFVDLTSLSRLAETLGREPQEPVSFKNESWASLEQPGRTSNQGNAVASVAGCLTQLATGCSVDTVLALTESLHRGPHGREPRHRPGVEESTEIFPDPNSFW